MSPTTIVEISRDDRVAAIPVTVRRTWRAQAWLATLFLFGIVHWLGFIYMTVPPSGQERQLVRLMRAPHVLFQRPTFSWQEGWFINDSWFIQLNILHVLQEAVRTRTMPYHVDGLARYQMVPTHEPPIGNRLLGMPSHLPWSPQVLLLSVLEVPEYLVLNWLLWYAVGFYGCLLIRRRYSLGLIAFTFLFLLVHLNGWITSGMTIRMGENHGYFLFPYLVLLFLRTGELRADDRGQHLRLGVGIGLTLGAMLLQGSAHPFIQWVTFLLVWGMCNPRLWRVTLLSGLMAGLASAASLLPAVVTWGLTPRHAAFNAYIQGYWAPDDYVNALAVAHRYVPSQDWGLYDMYVGIIGLIALVSTGLWGPFFRASWLRVRPRLATIVIPSLILVALSFRRMRHMLLPDWLPLFNAEVYTSRYIVIPFVFWIIVASINFQGVVERYWSEKKNRWAIVGGLIVTALSLLNHSRLWRLWYAVSVAPSWSPQGIPQPHLANDPSDGLYIFSCRVGLAISIVVWLVAAAWWLRGMIRAVHKPAEGALT